MYQRMYQINGRSIALTNRNNKVQPIIDLMIGFELFLTNIS